MHVVAVFVAVFARALITTFSQHEDNNVAQPLPDIAKNENNGRGVNL